MGNQRFRSSKKYLAHHFSATGPWSLLNGNDQWRAAERPVGQATDPRLKTGVYPLVAAQKSKKAGCLAS